MISCAFMFVFFGVSKLECWRLHCLCLSALSVSTKTRGFVVGFLWEKWHFLGLKFCPSYLRRNWDRGITVLACRLGCWNAGRFFNRFVRGRGKNQVILAPWAVFFFAVDRNPSPTFPVSTFVGQVRKKVILFLGMQHIKIKCMEIL